MKNQHLSDDALQLYAEGNKTTMQQYVSHVENCYQCQAEVRLYQNIFGHLGDDQSLLLSADFADKTILRLQQGTSVDRVSADWPSIAITTVVCIVVLFYFGFTEINWSVLMAGIKGFIPDLQKLKSGPFASVAVATLILGVISLMEKLILRHQNRA